MTTPAEEVAYSAPPDSATGVTSRSLRGSSRAWSGPVIPFGAVVLILGILLRVWVLRSPAGWLNGDEAITGLVARSINRRHFPVLVPGNSYGATTEAYLFRLLEDAVPNFGGPSALKGVSIACWLAASLGMWHLGRYLFDDLVGVSAGALLWITTGYVTLLSTRAYLGYSSGLFAVVVAMTIMTVRIGEPRSKTLPKWRDFVGGLAIGGAIWSHPMFVTALIVPCGVIAVQSLRRRRLPVLYLVGTTLALAPYLVWNARNGWPAFDGAPPPFETTYFERMQIFWTELFPNASGLRANGRWVAQPVGYVFYGMILALALLGTAMLWRRGAVGRTLALSAVALTPLMAIFPSLAYVEDARYAIIAMAIWPIVMVAPLASLRAVRSQVAVSILAIAALLALNIPVLRTHGAFIKGDPHAQMSEAVTRLDSAGIRGVRGDYWAAVRVAFAANNQLVFSTADVSPWVDRFPDSARAVKSLPNDSVAIVVSPWIDPAPLLLLPESAYDFYDLGELKIWIPKTGAS